MSCVSGFPFDFTRGLEGAPEVDLTGDNPFDAFAYELSRELAPRNLLERVLADRVVFSAWTLQSIGVKELFTIVDPSSLGGDMVRRLDAAYCGSPVDGSAENLNHVVGCLEKALDLLLRLRGQAPLPGREPVPAAPDRAAGDEDVESRFASEGDFDLDPEFEGDSEYGDDPLAELSNEWPVVPRGRGVEHSPDVESEDGGGRDEESLGERWDGRLVLDLNVSEDSPVIKGTWITVGQVVSLVVDGWSWSDILRTHPELTEDDIRVCLAYTVAEDDGKL